MTKEENYIDCVQRFKSLNRNWRERNYDYLTIHDCYFMGGWKYEDGYGYK